MESQKVRDNRKAKFLAKMESKKNANKKEVNKNIKPKENSKQTSEINPNFQLNNMKTTQPSNNSFEQQNSNPFKNNINSNNNKTDLNTINIIKNLSSINNVLEQSINKGNPNIIPKQKEEKFQENENKDDKNNQELKEQKKINFNEVITKMSQIDYMINFQCILKKIIIIILSIVHCFNFSPLDNISTLKYTIIIIEISSIFFNKYYNEKKKNLTNNNLGPQLYKIPKNDIDNKKISNNKIQKISIFLSNNFAIFNQFLFVINIIRDIFSDISILLLINIAFFIIRKEK